MSRSDLVPADEGELTPAMRELPNDRWRAFVRAWCDPANRQNAAHCARVAGFQCESAESFAKVAYRLLNDQRIVEAVQELARKQLRSLAPKATAALDNLLDKSGHKDHARAIGMVLDRTDPTTQTIDVKHTHEVIDRDKDLVEAYRYLVSLDVTREKMVHELGGPNILTRAERLAALEDAKRAEAAEVIDAKFTEVPAVDDFMKPWPEGGNNER